MKKTFLAGLILCSVFGALLPGCDPRGCNLVWQSNFYGYISREDLIRIPLIQPYELLTLANLNTDIIDSSDYRTVSWQLKFKNPGMDHINTTDFNVMNGIIYGSGKRSGYAPNDYFVVIPARKKTLPYPGMILQIREQRTRRQSVQTKIFTALISDLCSFQFKCIISQPCI